MAEVKKEIRILGVDDTPFERGDEETQVICTLFRAGEYLDGLLSTKIEVDGADSTDKLVKLVNDSRTKDQLKVIMTDGITLGGFNVLDIRKLNEKTSLPVIVFMRDIPDFQKIKSAILNVKDGDKKYKLIESAGQVYKFKVTNKEISGTVYFQFAGLEEKTAKEILNMTIKHGLVPEPLRTAHLIAQGIKFGESKGRA